MKELIEKAYGDHYEKFKDLVDEDGWVLDYKYWHMDAEDLFCIECEVEDIGYGSERVVQWRPALLGDLVYNNGWFKIESKEDLPKNDTDCWIMQGDRIYRATLWNYRFWHSEVTRNENPITHYQPIIKPKSPIY